MKLQDLAFLDEFGANTAIQRTHGRAVPGQRVVSKVPHGHWKTISTVVAMTTAGMMASASFGGATSTEIYLAFVELELAPSLRAGQVVVMDNLSPQKNA